MILVPSLSDIERRSTSAAERGFARRLLDIDGGPDAAAFYSINLRNHAYKQQAEADFVILWKGIVVVVEVKGGGVRKERGVWYSVDRRGDWHRLRTSPMEQAQSAAYALRDILSKDGLGWYAHEAVVVTPDIDAPPTDVAWLPTHWLGREHMTVDGITAALDSVVTGARQAPARTRIATTADLRTRLFGEFTRMPVIDAQRGAVIEEQNRATTGQARVLAALARAQRVLVYGGAGTGKSLVLVEAAKQEVDQGRSVLITFRSPALAEFFAPHVDGHDIDVVPFDDLTGQRRYDVVLVDEAQDTMTAEAMDRIDKVIAGGRSDGRWRMFLDQNNQAHIDGGYDEDVAELIGQEAVPVDLELNVRNTRSIVHVVQEYLGADIGDPGIVHGDKVAWHNPGRLPPVEAAEAVARTVVADGVARESIWIIDVSSSAEPYVTDDGYTVTSPRWAKGLEAEHVVLCQLPEEFDEAGVAAFYVATTRARVSLHVLADKKDKRRLQELVRRRMEKA